MDFMAKYTASMSFSASPVVGIGSPTTMMMGVLEGVKYDIENFSRVLNHGFHCEVHGVDVIRGIPDGRNCFSDHHDDGGLGTHQFFLTDIGEIPRRTPAYPRN